MSNLKDYIEKGQGGTNHPQLVDSLTCVNIELMSETQKTI